MWIQFKQFHISPELAYENENKHYISGEPATLRPNVELITLDFSLNSDDILDFKEWKLKSKDTWVNVTYIRYESLEGIQVAYVDMPVQILCTMLNKCKK